jgi:uncharacterized repeat protein (TIGR01451 family)
MIPSCLKLTNLGMAPASQCLAAAVLMLTACSCNMARRTQASKAASDPFLEESPVKVVSHTEDGSARRPGGEGPKQKQVVRQASHEAPAGEEGREIERQAIERVNAEPRCPEVDGNPAIDESTSAAAKLYPDEYLFDGGDRDCPIQNTDSRTEGLDTEDAAIEYRDDSGARRVRPTNRVAIYSPRFAAVTVASQPLEDVGGGRPTQAIVTQSGVGYANREGTFAQHQRDGTERLVTRVRGSGLKSEVATDAVDLPLAMQGHIHTTIPAADIAFVRTGIMKQTDEPRLAASIQSAVVWTRDQYPVIEAHEESVGEIRSRFKELELVGVETRHKKGLRIVKLADKGIAQPGDIVTFTIRFDNLGLRELRDVAIVDNLTPRLEYVEDSGTLSINGENANGRLVTEDNGEGSVILRWELDEPLAPKTGGVVTFQARVR